MRVASRVEMLEISTEVLGKPEIINPTLIWDQGTAILVDAGNPGQLPLIRAAVEQAGVSFDKLNMLLLTHHDIDHIGGLVSMREALPAIQVLAHTEEKPYIEGEQRPLKLAPFDGKLDSLPEDMKELVMKMNSAFAVCHSKVDKTLSDGQELSCNGGIKVIHTPGHTLGHICLYLTQSKILITGDALFGENGTLVKPPELFNYDNEMIVKSLKKLTGYDISKVICYHGGLYQDNVNQRIAELAAG